MIYVKTSGTFTEGKPNYEQSLLSESGCTTLENALLELGYYHTLDIGSDESVSFELHMNTKADASPAAIGFVNFISTYETYYFQSRHAVMMFLKEFAPTIMAVNQLQAED